MGINSGIYKLVLVLHILSAIVGFGAVLLNGIYGQQARSRRGTEGLAITQANFLVSRIAQFFIYAVFVFGILLVVLSDKVGASATPGSLPRWCSTSSASASRTAC
jgi:hypothetical protein